MKKTGFTLAEVLITLAIIGVVATMTLPALMNNTQEQQAKTGLKKGLNTLTEAAQTNLAIDGYDYGSVGLTSTNPNANEQEQSIGKLLADRTQIDYGITNFGAVPAANTPGSMVDGAAGNQVIFFRDGSALSVKFAAINPTTEAALDARDNLPIGINAIYDYNGARKPNRLSNCQHDANKLANGATADAAADSIEQANDACTKAERVIKDQFEIILRGGYAYPRGAAAIWAYNN